ncbi:MAG: beta-lactamase family protein, partial [Acidobacteria bacterium]|nr:beta-lactamase family protein [Acidobacteriota bacterium]
KAKGYGLANVELNVPATPETIYRLASTGKLFIATGIMLLVEEGKLSLDDPISKYLAGIPDAWQKITVRHLLSHTSGVAHDPPGYDPLKVQSDIDVIKSAYPTPLLFPPGEKAGYSNLGYFILGEVISKASGKPWSEYITERIFKPLGMNATRTTSMADIVPNRASGYALNGDKLQNVQIPLALRPSGAFLSSVLDLAKFDAALYTEKILKKSSLEQMWQPVKETNTGEGVVKGSSFGLGWVVANVNGHRVVLKSGSNSGFRATFMRFVDSNLTVVILANGERVRQTPLGYEIASFYIPGLAYKEDQASEATQ